MKQIKLVVTKPHRSEYPDPISFDKGAPLCIGEKYSGSENWEDWYLCSTLGQKEGWVPRQVIERINDVSGIAKEAYTAKELDVDPGEVLLGSKELNGWIWCMRLSRSEEGWVPLKNIRKMENTALRYITLTEEDIVKEHICCAFSDKKCSEGYELKKEWLKKEFANGYVFKRLDARAKVFIEYVPAEYAWLPVTAPNYLMVNCFWVSGQYKGQGHGYALLQSVIEDAEKQQKSGLVTVVGTKKNPFMSDTKWLLKHGFKEVEKLPNGFSLLAMNFHENSILPSFNDCVKSGECPDKQGLVAYYSNRCPYTDYYVNGMLRVLAQERNIPLKVIRLETREQAQSSPTPATIFSLFYNGTFVTTDLSVCTESKFAKLVNL